MTDRVIRAALVVAGAMTLLGASSAVAQQALPRIGTAAPPRAPQRPIGRAAEAPPHQVPDPRFPSTMVNDPRFPRDPRFPQSAYDPRNARPGASFGDRFHRRPPTNGSTVIILPTPGDYGYGYSQRGYYSAGYGGVYDVNGRPLSASLEPAAPVDGAVYTPDLSGSPYTITNEGMMVVDFADRPRRAFPSCAGQSSIRDPQGRPRTIFYQPSDYWMVLRPGQQGRVQGEPANDAASCYAIDSVGRVVLRY
ncbi:MAG TPA: hypothetical protein VGP25_20535 [Gemmatimonadaceae bacterium]|jgi:hypothetical protein|nr:hypothetical protein [Gemmatimonadaceae bacterium]